MYGMIKSKARNFWRDENGLGTLEMLLILAIIVVIAIAMRKWIMKWVGELFNKANSDIGEITGMDSDTISPPDTP
ncbi:Flp1 family type IVb pilin [Gorillibacterium sp. sgz5001074]|uniref:Flp1 family type IVb pilin n=1 Tax=Gorillibacterium sp. sgz5001074 TaxID=3446695 RepID=UPI003F670DD5